MSNEDVRNSNDDEAIEEIAAENPTSKTAPEDLIRFLRELDEIDSKPDDVPFENLDEMLATEKAEREGLWVDWPACKGARILLAHTSAASEKMDELERKYRAKGKRPPSEPLPIAVRARIVEEALFGAVVKDWSGIARGGFTLPFNRENFKWLMKENRWFRTFIFQASGDSDKFRQRAMEELRGNSPTA